jgi:hypothetical protein
VDYRLHRAQTGTISWSARNPLKLIAILALTASATGYFAFNSVGDGQRDYLRAQSDSRCSDGMLAGAEPSCLSFSAMHQTARSDERSAYTASRLDSGDGRWQGAHDGHPNSGAELVRGRPADQSRRADIRYGHTIAELCVFGQNNSLPHCQTVSADDVFSVPDTSVMSDASSTHTISGHVLTGGGVGLSGIAVIASPEQLRGERPGESGTLRFQTATDGLGAYALEGLPDGSYSIRSAGQGPYQSAKISVRAGVDYADLVVSQDSKTTVEGQVVNAYGDPLEGVTVLPDLLGQPSVMTDGDGRFRLVVALKPKVRSLTLRLQRPGYTEQSRKIHRSDLDGMSDAPVKLVMRPVESWTSLSGIVYSDSGDPLGGRAIELRLHSSQRTYSATTDLTGQYTFPFLESPATYRLIVLAGSGHKDYQENLDLTADTTELDITVESYEFGDVTGRLVNLNGVPIADFDLSLRNSGSRKPNVVFRTDKSGNFEVSAVPAGEFVVASQSMPSMLVQGLKLQPGDKLHLPLVLDWGEHQIHGIVIDSRGVPVPASRIVLQWSHQAEGIMTLATRRTASDTQGNFVFSKLGPGPHSLKVNAPGYSPVDIDHDLSRDGYSLTVRLN